MRTGTGGVASDQIDTFRDVWVRGSLEYQRALEALEAATRSAAEMCLEGHQSLSDQEERRIRQDLDNTRRRIAEIQCALEAQFDRFCGVSRSR